MSNNGADSRPGTGAPGARHLGPSMSSVSSMHVGEEAAFVVKSFTTQGRPGLNLVPGHHGDEDEDHDAGNANGQQAESRAVLASKAAAAMVRLAQKAKASGNDALANSLASQITRRKWKELGNMIKLTQGGVNRLVGLVKEKKETFMAMSNEAIHYARLGLADVRLNVANLKALQKVSYLQQGDASMYTPEALEQRYRVRSSPEFVAAVKAWWQWLPTTTLPPLAPGESSTHMEPYYPKDKLGITKPTYCAMAMMIQKVLLPRFDVKPDRNYDPVEDWRYDSKGQRFMMFPQFLHSLFELADMWCPTLEADDYALILTELLRECQELDARTSIFSRYLKKFQRLHGMLDDGDGEDGEAGGRARKGEKGDWRSQLRQALHDEDSIPDMHGATGDYLDQFNVSLGEAQSGVRFDANVGVREVPRKAPGGGWAGLSDDEDEEGDEEGGADGGNKCDMGAAEDKAQLRGWWDKVMARNDNLQKVRQKEKAAQREQQAPAGGSGGAAAGAAAAGQAAADPAVPDARVSKLLAAYATLPDSKGSSDQQGGAAADKKQGKGAEAPAASMPDPPPRMSNPGIAYKVSLAEALFDASTLSVEDTRSLINKDGTLQLSHCGAHTMAATITGLVRIKRFRTPHIRKVLTGSEAGYSTILLQPNVLCAIRTALTRAGLKSWELGEVMASHGMGLKQDVEAEALEHVSHVLAKAGFETLQIVPFLCPPPAEVLAGGVAGASAGEGGMWQLNEVQEATMRLALTEAGVRPEQVEAVRSWNADLGVVVKTSDTLEESGFTPVEVQQFISPAIAASVVEALQASGLSPAAVAAALRPDGTRLLPSLAPNALAAAVTAMAGASFPASLIAAVVGPGSAAVMPLQPAEQRECLDALAAAGFDVNMMSEMLEEGRAAASSVEPEELARMVAVLAAAGKDTDSIRRMLFVEARPVHGIEELPSLVQKAMNNAVARAGLAAAAAGAAESITLASGPSTSMPSGARNRITSISGAVDALAVGASGSSGFRGLLLMEDGSGLAPAAGAKQVSLVGEVLSEAMFQPGHIKSFLEPGSRVSEAGVGDASVVAVGRSHLTARDIAVFRAVLSASGLEPQELLDLLHPDAYGFDAETDPVLVARAVAALAASGFSGCDIQLFCTAHEPTMALTPFEADATRQSLEDSGFRPQVLASLLRPDGLGLVPGADTRHMAQVAAVLARTGMSAREMCQYLAPELPYCTPERQGAAGDETAPAPPPVVPVVAPELIHSMQQCVTKRSSNLPLILAKKVQAIIANGVCEGVPVEALAVQKAASALVLDGFSPSQVLQFLLRQWLPQGHVGMPLRLPRVDHLSPALLAVVHAVLHAGGFSQPQLVAVMAPDGRRLDPDGDPKGAAKLVAALAAGGFGADVVRLLLVPGPPVPALTPAEVEAVVDLLKDGGFRDSRLEVLLRSDQSHVSGNANASDLAQLAAALATNGVSVGHICRFLGPDPAPELHTDAHGSSRGSDLSEYDTVGDATCPPSPARTLRAASTRAATFSFAATLTPDELMKLSIPAKAPLPLPLSLSVSSMEDVRSMASVCGLMSKTMADTLRADRNGLTATADPRVVERVAAGVTAQGFTPAQVLRFIMPHGGCSYGKLDARTAAALRSVLVASGFTQQELKSLLRLDGLGVVPSATPAVIASMVCCLAMAGVPEHLTRQFLKPPQPHRLAAADGAAAGATLSPEELEAAHDALLEGGFTETQVHVLLRASGTGVAAIVGPHTLAQVVAVLAQAGLPSPQIRQLIRPLGGADPSTAAAMRAALARTGFAEDMLKYSFTQDGTELSLAVDTKSLANIMDTLATSGMFTIEQLKQVISLDEASEDAAARAQAQAQAQAARSGADTGADGDTGPDASATTRRLRGAHSRRVAIVPHRLSLSVTGSAPSLDDVAAMRRYLVGQGVSEATMDSLRVGVTSPDAPPDTGIAAHPRELVKVVSKLAQGSFTAAQIRGFATMEQGPSPQDDDDADARAPPRVLIRQATLRRRMQPASTLKRTAYAAGIQRAERPDLEAAQKGTDASAPGGGAAAAGQAADSGGGDALWPDLVLGAPTAVKFADALQGPTGLGLDMWRHDRKPGVLSASANGMLPGLPGRVSLNGLVLGPGRTSVNGVGPAARVSVGGNTIITVPFGPGQGSGGATIGRTSLSGLAVAATAASSAATVGRSALALGTSAGAGAACAAAPAAGAGQLPRQSAGSVTVNGNNASSGSSFGGGAAAAAGEGVSRQAVGGSSISQGGAPAVNGGGGVAGDSLGPFAGGGAGGGNSAMQTLDDTSGGVFLTSVSGMGASIAVPGVPVPPTLMAGGAGGTGGGGAGGNGNAAMPQPAVQLLTSLAERVPEGTELQLSRYLLRTLRHVLGEQAAASCFAGLEDHEQCPYLTELTTRLLNLARGGLCTIGPPSSTLLARNAVLSSLLAALRSSPLPPGNGVHPQGVAATLLRFMVLRAAELRLLGSDGRVLAMDAPLPLPPPARTSTVTGVASQPDAVPGALSGPRADPKGPQAAAVAWLPAQAPLAFARTSSPDLVVSAKSAPGWATCTAAASAVAAVDRSSSSSPEPAAARAHLTIRVPAGAATDNLRVAGRASCSGADFDVSTQPGVAVGGPAGGSGKLAAGGSGGKLAAEGSSGKLAAEGSSGKLAAEGSGGRLVAEGSGALSSAAPTQEVPESGVLRSLPARYARSAAGSPRVLPPQPALQLNNPFQGPALGGWLAPGSPKELLRPLQPHLHQHALTRLTACSESGAAGLSSGTLSEPSSPGRHSVPMLPGVATRSRVQVQVQGRPETAAAHTPLAQLSVCPSSPNAAAAEPGATPFQSFAASQRVLGALSSQGRQHGGGPSACRSPGAAAAGGHGPHTVAPRSGLALTKQSSLPHLLLKRPVAEGLMRIVSAGASLPSPTSADTKLPTLTLTRSSSFAASEGAAPLEPTNPHPRRRADADGSCSNGGEALGPSSRSASPSCSRLPGSAPPQQLEPLSAAAMSGSGPLAATIPVMQILPPESLYARVLAEVLRWLTLPVGEAFSPIKDWRMWLAVERARMPQQQQQQPVTNGAVGGGKNQAAAAFGDVFGGPPDAALKAQLAHAAARREALRDRPAAVLGAPSPFGLEAGAAAGQTAMAGGASSGSSPERVLPSLA